MPNSKSSASVSRAFKMRKGEHDEHVGTSSVLADIGMISLSSGGNGRATPADGVGGGAEAGRVVCTTELGLRCMTVRKARG